eukprot:comp20223_c0_seq3/m.25190 comp20223_c0_seq3/g.25190  ORF comp20223_c0_seq3/g.25190 comp20223_c0_seq3/m.25190 type:complete len:483 (-) comp20223_c0_seq3:488-1936(-)
MALMDRNETLFYKVVMDDLAGIAPLIYTPTVGEACQKFSALYRRARGMYFSSDDKGAMHSMVYNWHADKVDVICVTDGSRILGLGDLGCQGMGIPIGKLSLYVACGGVDPGRVLPIQLDFGTDNPKLLNNPLYIGRPHPRIKGPEFFGLVDEFVDAVTSRWPGVMVQFEDFMSENAHALLKRYRYDKLVFNDDIQGTGAVALAGVFSYLRIRGLPSAAIKEQRVVCLGAGSAGVGVLDAITNGMVNEGMTREEAGKNFWMLDVKGLVTKKRANEEQMLFSRDDMEDGLNLLEVVKRVKPTVLLGLSTAPNTFTEEIIREMSKYCDRPFICPMSNPTSKSECTTEQAFRWTEGKAIVATGSPFAPVTINGKTYYSSQGNNMYIFPSLGLASAIAQPRIITDSMLYVAARTLGEALTEEDVKMGKTYPDIEKIQACAKKITAAVVRQAHAEGLARAPMPENLEEEVEKQFFRPNYLPLVRHNVV